MYMVLKCYEGLWGIATPQNFKRYVDAKRQAEKHKGIVVHTSMLHNMLEDLNAIE